MHEPADTMHTHARRYCRDLQDDVYNLIVDPQEVEHVAENVGVPKKWLDDITGTIVWIGDGDYVEVWFTESASPWDLRAEYRTALYYLDES